MPLDVYHSAGLHLYRHVVNQQQQEVERKLSP
jgi:hypothetical protein